MDRRTITIGDLIEPAPPMELTQVPVRRDEDEDAADALHELRTGSSAKIDQLVHLLSLTPATEKSLVFSQFTTFLDKIAEALDEAGIDYCRFDGQMTARRRQETLDAFSVPLREDDEDTACAHAYVARAPASECLSAHFSIYDQLALAPSYKLSEELVRWRCGHGRWR